MDLIYSQRVESPRLEFKKGWNPEKILHTMCAFANDIDEWGGGYIVVGVDMNSGEPKITGLDKTSLDEILAEENTNCLSVHYLLSSGDTANDTTAYFFKAELPDGGNRYLCCVKKNT